MVCREIYVRKEAELSLRESGVLNYEVGFFKILHFLKLVCLLNATEIWKFW